MSIAISNSKSEMAIFSATLAKKCERLATAIYLVTNFLSDTEPMKARLRSLSLDFVRDASLVKSGTQSVESKLFESLFLNISETLTLLELAFMAGLVSEMNFTILKREYVILRNMIQVKKDSHSSMSDQILGDNFFDTKEEVAEQRKNLMEKMFTIAPRKESSEGIRPIVMSDRNSKGHATQSDRRATPDAKNVTPKKTDATSSPAHPSHVRATTDVAKESRRSRILKLVKDNREVTIKDISTHFADLSEKTIQRELVALTDLGVLKKFGERRWSRYTLV